jgi:hypothetical protein
MEYRLRIARTQSCSQKTERRQRVPIFALKGNARYPFAIERSFAECPALFACGPARFGAWRLTEFGTGARNDARTSTRAAD